MELKIFYTVVIFIFGLLFGSFFIVVGWRVPKGLSIVKPGSFCPKCKHKLRWYELIPVFSYLIQGGKCRSCKARIAPFYTITELFTGILFALSYWFLGFSFEFIIAVITASFFSIVLVSDINFLIIPDQFTLIISAIVVILRLVLVGAEDAIFSLIYGIGAFVIMYLLMILGNFILKKESLGGGDIKLMGLIGVTVGFIPSLICLFISSVFGLIFSLLAKSDDKTHIIPFGPFLLFSALLCFYFAEPLKYFIEEILKIVI